MEDRFFEFSLEPKEIEKPNDIIFRQLQELNKLTKGKVIARISECDKEYYEKRIDKDIDLSSLLSSDFLSEVLEEHTGEFSASVNFLFEVYLTSTVAKNYKYVIFFIDYNIDIYPASLVIDRDIALELELDREVWVDNEEKLLYVLKRIFNSKKIVSILNKLISL